MTSLYDRTYSIYLLRRRRLAPSHIEYYLCFVYLRHHITCIETKVYIVLIIIIINICDDNPRLGHVSSTASTDYRCTVTTGVTTSDVHIIPPPLMWVLYVACHLWRNNLAKTRVPMYYYFGKIEFRRESIFKKKKLLPSILLYCIS